MLVEWALRSHRRAAAATEEGRLSEEIVGVKVSGKKGETDYVEADESIRFDASLEQLAALEPLDEGGTVTPGNASGVTDGAGALVIASEGFAERRNLNLWGPSWCMPRSPRTRRTCRPGRATPATWRWRRPAGRPKTSTSWR